MLTEKEASVIMFTRKVNAKILCLNHYKSAITSFLNRPGNKKCCNIFKKHKSPVGSYLTEVSIQLANQTRDFTKYEVVPGTKICTRMCLPLLEEAIDSGRHLDTFPPEPEVNTSQEDVAYEEFTPPKDPKEEVDECFKMVGLSPPRKNESFGHLNQKMNELNSAILKRLDPEGKFSFNENTDFRVFLNNLKQNHSTMTKKELFEIIKNLPNTWSSRKLAEETGIPLNFICDARNESLSLERKERSDKMSQELKQKIIDFYLSDRISKVMPGTTISVKYHDGHRELHCKQLMFHHVYEAHNIFCQMYPEDKVSLSQFRKLRPGQVVLVGAPGTHMTCKGSHWFDSIFLSNFLNFSVYSL